MHSSDLPPWDLLSFTFGWGSNITTTISQCDSVTLNYQGTVNGRTVNPPPTPPYTLILYSGEFETWKMSLDNSAATGNTQWLASLPVGPKFAVAMKDSRGYSGGIHDPAVQMTPGSGCNLTIPLKASSLNISVNDNSLQCQEVFVTVNNGVPPYTLKVIPLDNRTSKTMRFAISPLRFTLDLSVDVEYWLAVHDSQGGSGVKGSYKVGFSLDESCLNVATTVTAGKLRCQRLLQSWLFIRRIMLECGNNCDSGHVFHVISGRNTSAQWGCTRRTGSRRPAQWIQIVRFFAIYPYLGQPFKRSTNEAIFMAMAIPFMTVVFSLVLLWLCFRYSSRCCPSDRRDSSASLRHLVNPDLHPLGPIKAEPFDPATRYQQSATEHCPPTYTN
ncbi:hypothetical protein RSAG8_10934, partial [Rhizoctonia solani AG-8 WAC10335]